ncbi:hypothetical protein [Siccibacter turicensis]|uniref:hypothetical protein n=1 Tax=Siccibacter turicensis TaxID=357233 RepID=UPI003F5746A2
MIKNTSKVYLGFSGVNILRSIFITLFIYSVNFKFLPYDVPSSYYMLLVFVLCGMVLFFLNYNFVVVNRNATLFAFIFLFISLISYLINVTSHDEYMVRTSVMYLMILMFTGSLVTVLFKSSYLLTLRIIGYAGLINSGLIIAMLVFKDFQNFYLSLISDKAFALIGGIDALEGLISLRMIGVTGFSAYSTGFVQVLCCMCYILSIYYKKQKLSLKLYDYIVIFSILLSAVISARSSLLGILVIVIVVLRLTNSLFVLRLVLYSLCILIPALAVVINFIPEGQRDFFSSWLSEFFVSGIKTGSLQTNISMFKYNIFDFNIIGFSRWYGDNDDYFMNSDVGWYRLTFAVGYVGAAVWCFLISSTLGLKNVFSTKLSVEVFISWMLALYVFLMMFKGAILFDSFQSVFILLIVGNVLNRGLSNAS